MSTGRFDRQAVWISRSISITAFCGVMPAVAAVTWAYARRNSPRPPPAKVWCSSRLCSRATTGIAPATQITGTCSLYAPATPLTALSAPTPWVTTTAPRPFSRA